MVIYQINTRLVCLMKRQAPQHDGGEPQLPMILHDVVPVRRSLDLEFRVLQRLVNELSALMQHRVIVELFWRAR